MNSDIYFIIFCVFFIFVFSALAGICLGISVAKDYYEYYGNDKNNPSRVFRNSLTKFMSENNNSTEV